MRDHVQEFNAMKLHGLQAGQIECTDELLVCADSSIRYFATVLRQRFYHTICLIIYWTFLEIHCEILRILAKSVLCLLDHVSAFPLCHQNRIMLFQVRVSKDFRFEINSRDEVFFLFRNLLGWSQLFVLPAKSIRLILVVVMMIDGSVALALITFLMYD